MPINLQDKSTLRSDPIRVLAYGQCGSRKTTFASTFPMPMLVLDFDHKLTPLYGKDVDVESFSVPPTYGDQENRLTSTATINRFMSVLKAAKTNPKYKSICLDSISTLDPIVCWHFCNQQGKNNAEPTIEVYGMIRGFYDWLFLELNNLSIGKNIIVIGHEDRDKDDVTGMPCIIPLITSKVRHKLAAIFQETYYLYVAKTAQGKDEYRLRYEKTSDITASSQIIRGGTGYIIDPTYEKIMQASGAK